MKPHNPATCRICRMNNRIADMLVRWAEWLRP